MRLIPATCRFGPDFYAVEIVPVSGEAPLFPPYNETAAQSPYDLGVRQVTYWTWHAFAINPLPDTNSP